MLYDKTPLIHGTDLGLKVPIMSQAVKKYYGKVQRLPTEG